MAPVSPDNGPSKVAGYLPITDEMIEDGKVPGWDSWQSFYSVRRVVRPDDLEEQKAAYYAECVAESGYVDVEWEER